MESFANPLGSMSIWRKAYFGKGWGFCERTHKRFGEIPQLCPIRFRQIPWNWLETATTLSIGAKDKERMSCTSRAENWFPPLCLIKRLRQGQRKVYFAEEMMLLVVAYCFAPKLNPGHGFNLFGVIREYPTCGWFWQWFHTDKLTFQQADWLIKKKSTTSLSVTVKGFCNWLAAAPAEVC